MVVSCKTHTTGFVQGLQNKFQNIKLHYFFLFEFIMAKLLIHPTHPHPFKCWLTLFLHCFLPQACNIFTVHMYSLILNKSFSYRYLHHVLNCKMEYVMLLICVNGDCCAVWLFSLDNMIFCLLAYSDIKFLIGPNRKPIYAHRCILSTRCAVFKAMFNDQAQKGEGAQNANVPFVLTDISPEIFTAMMEFIYTNCVTLTPKIVSIINW